MHASKELEREPDISCLLSYPQPVDLNICRRATFRLAKCILRLSDRQWDMFLSRHSANLYEQKA